MTIRAFAKITCAQSGELHPARVVGCDHDELRFRARGTRAPHLLMSCYLMDEGCVWIRGHHAPESEQACALLASGALVGWGQLAAPRTLTVRVRGVPFPIEFADWTHDRLYHTVEFEGGDSQGGLDP